MSPNVSVVIPTLNSAKTIGSCLQALGAQSAEILVIDDQSTDGTQDIARSFGANVFEVDGKSAAAARNLGAARSAGEIVAFTDSDCVPAHNWIDSIQRAFKDYPDSDIIGGSIIFRDDTLVRRAYAAMYRLTDARSLSDNSIMLPAMNLSLGKAVFKELAFDETLPGALCDDVDFLKRALACHLRIRYRPEIAVTHLNPANLRNFFRQELRHGMGDAILRHRYPELGGGDRGRLGVWISESVLNMPGHVKEILIDAGTTNRLTLSAGVLNYARHVIGGFGHVKAAKLITAPVRRNQT